MKKLLAILGLVYATFSTLHADSILLAWDASPSSDVIGYRLYEAKGTAGFIPVKTLGNTLTTAWTVLEPSRYYVTAINSSGAESGPSNVVSYTPVTTGKGRGKGNRK